MHIQDTVFNSFPIRARAMRFVIKWVLARILINEKGDRN